MTDSDTKIRDRLGQLLDLVPNDGQGAEQVEECHSGLLGIMIELYGPTSPQVTEMLSAHENFALRRFSSVEHLNLYAFRRRLAGLLRSTIAAVDMGLLSHIRIEAAGGVYGSLVIAAKRAADEDQKDVAAVLGGAALEDALKRFALLKGLNVDEKSMTDVINALKGAGAIPSAQAEIAKSFVDVRNRAFHAQWDRVDKMSVQSLIAFTELFLAERF